MANWKWCALALIVSCVAVLGATDTDNSSKKLHSAGHELTTDEVSSQRPAETAVTVTPTTASTTPKTDPTTDPTTPKTDPTTAPTTPKTKPTTDPTTPPTPPTTPTPAPKTTTPAPAPSPVLPPKTGVWNVTDDKTNITCIVVQFAVKFNVSYVAGKTTHNVTFNLPEDSERTGGSCSNTSEHITLSWPREEDPINQNNFTLKFNLNATSHQYYVSKVKLALVYNASIFPNASSKANMELSSAGKEWMTALNYSYRCKREQVLKLTSAAQGGEGGNLAAEVTVSNVQEEAFRSEKGHQFGIAADCDGQDVPDMVPIAVGCTLGALVLIVLAAYMFGRRRSAAHGYVSM